MFCFQGALFSLSLYLQSQKQEVRQFKEQHPAVVFIGIVLVSYYLIYKLGSILVVMFGVMLPISFIILHASLRLRNVKNKLVNVSEAMGLAKKTPMALILNEMGIEADIKVL